MVSDVLEQGRAAYGARAWATAYETLIEADREESLLADDLELAARAAYLAGHDDDCLALLERAFNARVADDDPAGAALDAFWTVFLLSNRGEHARAGGWIARAQRVLENGPADCVARGYLLTPAALGALFSGDAAAALAQFGEQRIIAARHSDRDLLTLSGFGQGQALIALGRVAEGRAILDEIMLAVVAGDTSPMVSGLVYCGVIAACMETFDPRRAGEWTTALGRWCDDQPQLVPYRGQCMIHRAQIMALHGDWTDALDEARSASEQLTLAGHPAVGDAWYEQAELQRLRGDHAGAEENFRQAARDGRDTQPGLALLRLAQQQPQAASAGIRRALDETPSPIYRPRLLAAAVEIALSTDDRPAATTWADELERIADQYDASLLRAMADYAMATERLAGGDLAAALTRARRSWTAWRALGAPYEAARARVVVGLVCRAVGDEDAAQMDLDAAREAFAGLSAAPDLARVEALMGRPAPPSSAGLSPREVEVLRLVATGRTNRAIAGELFLSEKTVARHLSNIFLKIDVGSRAAATAYAYEHGLV